MTQPIYADKRLTVVGVAIRLELQRPMLMHLAQGNLDVFNREMRKALDGHRDAMAEKPPLLE